MKSKKRYTWKIVLFIIGLVLVFFIGTTIYRITSWDRLVNYIESSLLEKDSECELPCWIGIIPGETNVSEALTLLDLDPKLNSLTREFEDNEYRNNVSLRSGYFLIGGELVRLELKNDIVKSITLTRQIDMSLSEILTTFGLPLAVYPSPGGPSGIFYWYFILYYPDKGIVVCVVTDEDEDSREITPSSRVLYIDLKSKNAVESMIEEDKTFPGKAKKLMDFPCPWKGYGNVFDIYEGCWW
jgi:hypothetical protein